jgi:nucleoside-diphosphate-sugar epimerase
VPERFLVTGAYGCIGAWVVRQLVHEGIEVVALDAGGSDHRLAALLTDEERARVSEVRADVSAKSEVDDVFAQHRPTHVVHLAALQVPFCAADPVLGAAVNVVGTVTIFEAARRAGLETPVVFASSVAAHDALDAAEGEASLTGHPGTHYGVYKWANEGTARVYWQDAGVRSIGLRPYVVYGLGRDQGMTSEPTKAMAAAAQGLGHVIPYSGTSQMQYAADVAAAFVAAARSSYEGAAVVNVPGASVSVREIVDMIEREVPAVAGKFEIVERELPFPPSVDSSDFEAIVGNVPATPLDEGIRETIRLYAAR